MIGFFNLNCIASTPTTTLGKWSTIRLLGLPSTRLSEQARCTVRKRHVWYWMIRSQHVSKRAKGQSKPWLSPQKSLSWIYDGSLFRCQRSIATTFQIYLCFWKICLIISGSWRNDATRFRLTWLQQQWGCCSPWHGATPYSWGPSGCQLRFFQAPWHGRSCSPSCLIGVGVGLVRLGWSFQLSRKTHQRYLSSHITWKFLDGSWTTALLCWILCSNQIVYIMDISGCWIFAFILRDKFHVPFIQERLGKVKSEQAKLSGTKYLLWWFPSTYRHPFIMEIWPRHAQQIQGRVDAMKVSYTKLEALQAEVAVSRSARLDYLYFRNVW